MAPKPKSKAAMKRAAPASKNDKPAKRQKEDPIGYRVKRIESVLAKSSDPMINGMLQDCCYEAFMAVSSSAAAGGAGAAPAASPKKSPRNSPKQHPAPGGSSSSSSTSTAATSKSLHDVERETIHLIKSAIHDQRDAAYAKLQKKEREREDCLLEKDDVKNKREMLEQQGKAKKTDLEAEVLFASDKAERRKKVATELKKMEKQLSALQKENEGLKVEAEEGQAFFTDLEAGGAIEGGGVVEGAGSVLKKMKVEESLVVATTKALKKEPDSRTKFEEAAIQAVKSSFADTYFPALKLKLEDGRVRENSLTHSVSEKQAELTNLDTVIAAAKDRVAGMEKEVRELDEIAKDLETRLGKLKKSFTAFEQEHHDLLLGYQETMEALTFVEELVQGKAA